MRLLHLTINTIRLTRRKFFDGTRRLLSIISFNSRAVFLVSSWSSNDVPSYSSIGFFLGLERGSYSGSDW